eukprot:4471471-Pyramimonas_sp.AAC.1
MPGVTFTTSCVGPLLAGGTWRLSLLLPFREAAFIAGSRVATRRLGHELSCGHMLCRAEIGSTCPSRVLTADMNVAGLP